MIMARKHEMAQAARIATLDAGAHAARTEFVNNEEIEEEKEEIWLVAYIIINSLAQILSREETTY